MKIMKRKKDVEVDNLVGFRFHQKFYFSCFRKEIGGTLSNIYFRKTL